jgi:hypothetical protein
MPVSDTVRDHQQPIAGVLYRLAIALPSWAGAISALYGLYLCGFAATKIRQR